MCTIHPLQTHFEWLLQALKIWVCAVLLGHSRSTHPIARFSIEGVCQPNPFNTVNLTGEWLLCGFPRAYFRRGTYIVFPCRALVFVYSNSSFNWVRCLGRGVVGWRGHGVSVRIEVLCGFSSAVSHWHDTAKSWPRPENRTRMHLKRENCF